MSKKALDPVNMLSLASAPTLPTLAAGDQYFNTTSNTLFTYTGSTWVSGGGASAGSATPLALGTAAAGSASSVSHEDHIHPTTGVGLTASPLSQFASTTSLQLDGIISDGTGTGALVFGTAPTISTPVINNVNNGFTTTVTSGTAVVLTNASTYIQQFTGSTAQTITLPVVTTLATGWRFYIQNLSTAVITVRSSGSNNLSQTVPAGTSAEVTCILATGTTAASWRLEIESFATVTGTGNAVLSTSPTFVTPVLGTPSSGTLTSCTGLPIAGTTGWGTGVATALAAAVTGSGSIVLGTSPSITTPKITLSYTAKTASYTFVSGDEGNIFSMNNAATQAFTVPVDATFNFAIGTEFHMLWVTGAGQPTISAVTPGTTAVISTGATSATPKLRVANSMATILKIAANSWVVTGDIA